MAERCDLCEFNGSEDIYYEDIKIDFDGDTYQLGACCHCAAGLLNSILSQLPPTERGPVFKEALFAFIMSRHKKED